MSLSKFRKQIDKIDKKLVSLLEKRLLLAKELKKEKKKITDKKREKEILEKINSKYIQDIYKYIFKISKKFQKI
jgi:chorismate mutase